MARQAGQLVRQLRRKGCEVVMSRSSGHWKVYLGDRLVTTLPATPGGHGRTFANALAELRRAGIQV